MEIPLAVALSLLAVGGGLMGLTVPERLARSLGPPIPATVRTTDLAPFVAFIGARNLSSGLTTLTLLYLGYRQAAGVTLLIGSLTAVADCWICWRSQAEQSKTVGHGFMAVVIGVLGGLIYRGR